MKRTKMIGCENGWRLDKNEFVNESTGEIYDKTYTAYQWVIAPTVSGGQRWRELGELNEAQARLFWDNAKLYPVYGITAAFDGDGAGNVRFDAAIHKPTTGEKDMSIHRRPHDYGGVA